MAGTTTNYNFPYPENNDQVNVAEDIENLAVDVDSQLASHNTDTTNVHGITDTSTLISTSSTGVITSSMIVNGTIINEDISASAEIDQSKIANLTTDLSNKASLTISLNQTVDSYTLVLGDAGKLIEMGKETAQTLTVPLNSSVPFTIGTKIDVIQTGAGETTIAATSGVTINSEGGKLKINAQWQAATLIKSDTDTWILIGALKS